MRRVTLEVSLKPFWDLHPDAIRDVAREIFRQWVALHRHAEEISILIWAADGSEILDYAGDLDQTFEWAHWMGIANPRGHAHNDPEGLGLHSRPYEYRENPPEYRYRDLAAVVRTLREVGREMTGKRIHVGATFDPGGEFARSSFKYERHPEICMANTMGQKTFVCCYATLNADSRPYAAFPRGIAQHTTLGTFLGAQARCFMADLGFDYIWLSNGLGFGMETWKATGPMFDGHHFDPSAAPAIREKILRFWRDFRANLGEFPVEVRGTNLGTGADLATDAVPLREIMEGGYGIRGTAPNSPWAAINGDFGVEMVGYMSRVAEIPQGVEFSYRYYTHDPWWINSPWLDRYGREAHDIYLPLAVARMTADGEVKTPDTLALLTIDDSYGRMPVQVPNEVTPHLLHAWETAPDAPGLITWVYPYDAFHDMAKDAPERLGEAFFHDWFVRCAVNNALPLNTVVSDRALAASLKARPAVYRQTVLLSRVPDAGSDVEQALLAHARAGGRVLLYGSTRRASDEMRQALNLRLASGIHGTLELEPTGAVDHVTGGAPTRLVHRPEISDGPIEEILAANDSGGVLASVTSGTERRIVAIARGCGAGRIAWVRGSLTSAYPEGGSLVPDDPREHAQGEQLLRDALAALGVQVSTIRRNSSQRQPVLTASRHAGGLWFSGYMPDTTATLVLNIDDGAPILVGCDAEMSEGAATYRLPLAWRRECRVLAQQQGSGVIRCREHVSVMVGISRRILLEGLENATVRFLPVPGTEKSLYFQVNPRPPYVCGPFTEPIVEERFIGECRKLDNVTGSLLISW